MVLIHKCGAEDNLPHKFGEFLLQNQDKALSKNDVFNVAISGGSLVDVLGKALISDAEIANRVDWAKWHIYFVDERIVPLNHADSNYKAFKQAVLDKLPVQPKMYPINELLVNKGPEGNEQLAKEYEDILPKKLDILLLGCGPDGHTCSLFPGDRHKYLIEEKIKRVVWCHDSPKPPSDRITITLPVMEDAGAICFVALGASKQRIMHEIFDVKNTELPSALVNKLFDDKVNWFIDTAAFETVTTKY